MTLLTAECSGVKIIDMVHSITDEIVIGEPVACCLDCPDELNDTADYYDEYEKMVEELAASLNIAKATAYDVIYFRERSRHTPELEAELIRLHGIGKAPNICDWP